MRGLGRAVSIRVVKLFHFKLMIRMQSPVVSVVIPVFNQWAYTAQCLAALRAHTHHVPFEVIVVNNGSTDETAHELAYLSREWSALRVISLSVNTGFSPACNIGANAAEGELLLFLNNDTEPQPGWILPLLNEVKQPGVGLVGPKLVLAQTPTQPAMATMALSLSKIKTASSK